MGCHMPHGIYIQTRFLNIMFVLYYARRRSAVNVLEPAVITM